ncbi:3317_t:CDS:2, partial [Gigaspora rosea]
KKEELLKRDEDIKGIYKYPNKSVFYYKHNYNSLLLDVDEEVTQNVYEKTYLTCTERSESSFSLSQSITTDNEGLQIVTACNGVEKC